MKPSENITVEFYVITPELDFFKHEFTKCKCIVSIPTLYRVYIKLKPEHLYHRDEINHSKSHRSNRIEITWKFWKETTKMFFLILFFNWIYIYMPIMRDKTAMKSQHFFRSFTELLLQFSLRDIKIGHIYQLWYLFIHEK